MRSVKIDIPWGFQASSVARKRVLTLAEYAAPTDCPVLIVGPTGVGKDILANEIHRHSGRAERRFVPLNCAALGGDLFETEMFGHARGAFTGAHAAKLGLVELADGGTLFLDEVGELDMEAQAKLLRFLANGKFWPLGELRERTSDVRLILATNRDLRAMILAGTFREDLLYRINVVTLVVPPLEMSDVRHLAAHFARQSAERWGRSLSSTEWSELLTLVTARHFRGGARQIMNVLERFFLVYQADRSVYENWQESDELGRLDGEPVPPRSKSSMAAPNAFPAVSIQRLDDLVFLLAARTTRSVRELAWRLGRTPQAVYQRLQKLQLKPDELGDENKLSRLTTEASREAAGCLSWLQASLPGDNDS